MTDDFARQYARTGRFTSGHPRGFRITSDGQGVLFLRSRGGDDAVNLLWHIDLATGAERVLADPRELLRADDEGQLSAAERARRERLRESGSGIVAFAADAATRLAVFPLGGTTYVTDVADGTTRALPLPDGAFDPRPDPTGTRTAYVSDGALHVAEGATSSLLASDLDADVTWGVSDFIAAEEMGRSRGYWWAPDGQRLAVTRVDESRVGRWHVPDAANPEVEPQRLRYPAAGTVNADVTLWIVDLLGNRTEVAWDRGEYPYLATVRWHRDEPLTLLVQSRDQRRVAVLRVDADSGATASALLSEDPQWVELVPGTPAWSGGRVVSVVHDRETDTHRLALDGEPVTPAGLQVRSVLDAAGDAIWFTASRDPVDVAVHRLVPGEAPELVSPAVGVHTAAVRGATVVMTSATVEAPTRVVAWRDEVEAVAIVSRAEEPVVTPRPQFLELGPDRLRAVLQVPAGDGPFPVLLSPYGGPHAQRVLRARSLLLVSQWFADQGFAVLTIDGRGTPGRGPAWERAVDRDLATPVLADQVSGLEAAASLEPRLDLTRVGIRGWSFGGFLAVLAVLRRPDVFHAAVAGAPVTDWALYDTHYTERYLGTPQDEPDAYRVSSLVDASGALLGPAPLPEGTTPPALLIVHGLADDNVVAAHTLRLSQALLIAGRPHAVLPLTGVTHMASQTAVNENLLRHELVFLGTALAAAVPG